MIVLRAIMIGLGATLVSRLLGTTSISCVHDRFSDLSCTVMIARRGFRFRAGREHLPHSCARSPGSTRSAADPLFMWRDEIWLAVQSLS